MTAPFFELLRNRVSNAISASRAKATAVNHPGLAGELREIAADDLVRPFLTHSFKCGSGKIVDATGRMSKQIDLFIYSTRNSPAFMLSNERALIPVESCKYAFEVKSTLTASTIREAIEVGQSVQDLRGFPTTTSAGQVAFHNVGPVTVLLAFTSDIQGDELQRYLQYDTSSHTRFTTILVLDKGYWHRHPDGKSWSGLTLEEVPHPASFYAFFIAGMTNTLVQEEMTWRPFSPGRYMMPDGYKGRVYGPSGEIR